MYLQVFDCVKNNLLVRRCQFVEGTRVRSDALTIRCSFVAAALKHFTDLVIVWKVFDAMLRSPRKYVRGHAVKLDAVRFIPINHTLKVLDVEE